MPSLQIYQHRLTIVTGKGGVGKSTVSLALALGAAARGLQTLLVELSSEVRLPGLLGVPAPADPYRPLQVRPHLFLMGLDGCDALNEYLGMVLRPRALLSLITRSLAYKYFVAAAPGLRELMAMGKLYFELQSRNSADHLRWDFIVVDAPATGHGLAYLRMPRAALDAFPAGLVHREAQKVWAMLTDPATTVVHLVTLAEELPVLETCQLYEELVQRLPVPLGRLIVNRRLNLNLPASLTAALSTLKSTAVSASSPGGVDLPAEMRLLLECMDESAALAAGQLHYLKLLRERVPLPLVELPEQVVEEMDLVALTALSRELEAQVG